MRKIDPIQEDLLLHGLDGCFGLWVVARNVRELHGKMPKDMTVDQVRESALRHLEPLLLAGHIEAGFSPYEKGDFEPWGIPAEAALERIDKEWRRLGKDPNIPDICWFRNTESGNAVARTLKQ